MHTLLSLEGAPLQLVHRDVSPHNVARMRELDVEEHALQRCDTQTDARRTGSSRRRAEALSPPTRFFGRDAELQALRQAFAEGAKLVTLLGPGGMGKTRHLVPRRGRREIAEKPGQPSR